MNSSNRFDTIIVGGGLQGGLAALALARARPDARIAVVESQPALGGNHTWCFHAGDLEADGRALVEPLVAHRWDGYSVRFPGLERRVDESYAAVTSERFDRVVRAELTGAGHQLLLGQHAALVGPDWVELADGRQLEAPVVIDARGPRSAAMGGPVAYQKFVGLELELERPHRLERPVLMDALVPQLDGFRFVYVLPLAPNRVLIEDTYYSDSAAIDRGTIRERILEYALGQGLEPTAFVREESGVLPLPLSAPVPKAGLPLQAGYGGGWFHAVTGYSFPAAVRLALYIAAHSPNELFGSSWKRLVDEHQRQQRYFTFLNRLLFRAFAPGDRWNVLARFYGLPGPTIRRFYAMSTTPADRARILCGRPPRGLSLTAALRGVTS